MFKILNSDGRRGRVWDREYGSKRDAANAVADAMGWLDIAISDSFAVDEGTGWACYETVEAREADSDGAHAPRIIEVR